MGKAWRTSYVLEEAFCRAATTIDTLVMVKVGNYTLYRFTVILRVADSLLGSLYGSLSLSVALRFEGSREGVEDGCLLSPFFDSGICSSKLGAPI